MKEQEIQRSGMTDRETMAAIGEATNARYVLAGTITKLGAMNLFDVKILDIRNGQQIVGKDHEYQSLTDGIGIMKTLAWDVTGITEEQEAARRETEKRLAEEKRTAEEETARLLRISVSHTCLHVSHTIH
jgi:hypothetical protein